MAPTKGKKGTCRAIKDTKSLGHFLTLQLIIGVSVHSRAARRATSPGIDTDKSLKNVKLPQESVERRPAVLAAHAAAGISKKTSKRKTQLSSKARKRQEKNADRAEAIMDRTAVKVQRSKGHAKVIESRKRTWDEVNRQATGIEGVPKKKASKHQAEDDAVAEFYGGDRDGDEEMEEAGTGVTVQPRPALLSYLPVESTGDDDEEIL